MERFESPGFCDEPEEKKVFFGECESELCNWEMDSFVGSEEEIPSECPKCGMSVQLRMDYDNR